MQQLVAALLELAQKILNFLREGEAGAIIGLIADFFKTETE